MYVKTGSTAGKCLRETTEIVFNLCRDDFAGNSFSFLHIANTARPRLEQWWEFRKWRLDLKLKFGFQNYVVHDGIVRSLQCYVRALPLLHE